MNNIEEIRKIKEESILSITNSWGLHYPGGMGKIITKDKIYYYQYYYQNPFKELTDREVNYIKEYNLTPEQQNKIKDYIEKELLTKEDVYNKMYDATYEVIINYNNKQIKIINDLEEYKEIKEYIEKVINNEENK